MQLNKALALVIRGIRKSRGLSQEDFNTVDRSYLVRIEAGRANVTLEMLQRIAAVVGVELEILVLLTSAVQAHEPLTSVAQKLGQKIEQLASSDIYQHIDEAARELKSVPGRPKKAGEAQRIAEALKLRETGLSLAEIAQAMNLSKTTIHRYLSK